MQIALLSIIGVLSIALGMSMLALRRVRKAYEKDLESLENDFRLLWNSSGSRDLGSDVESPRWAYRDHEVEKPSISESRPTSKPAHPDLEQTDGFFEDS